MAASQKRQPIALVPKSYEILYLAHPKNSWIANKRRRF